LTFFPFFQENFQKLSKKFYATSKFPKSTMQILRQLAKQIHAKFPFPSFYPAGQIFLRKLQNFPILKKVSNSATQI
jgi:hypothetical protein